MKIAFIGGTGSISGDCSRYILEQTDYHVTLIHRSDTPQSLAKYKALDTVTCDVNNAEQIKGVLKEKNWDIIVDFVCFTPEQAASRAEIFFGKCAQYVFISTAAAYQTPAQRLPYTEECPLDNPFWEYAKNKASAESVFTLAAQKSTTKVTVVRPSHTYDSRRLVIPGKYTAVARALAAKPVIIAGDGTSLWTATHSRDFAPALCAVLGNAGAFGQQFHITNTEWLPWEKIFRLQLEPFGVEPTFCYVPARKLYEYHAGYGLGWFADKMHCRIFDTSRIQKLAKDWKCTISFAEGAREVAQNILADSTLQKADDELDRVMDTIVQKWG